MASVDFADGFLRNKNGKSLLAVYLKLIHFVQENIVAQIYICV